MNMKKTIAGLVASVVAISAMATTMVSATAANNAIKYTKDQAAATKTWNLTSSYYDVTWTGTAIVDLGPDYVKSTDAAGLVTFMFNTDVDSATLKLTGGYTIGTSAETPKTETITLKRANPDNKKVYTLTTQDGASTTTNGVFPTGYFEDGIIKAELTYTVADTFGTKKLADAAAENARVINVQATAAFAGVANDAESASVIAAGYATTNISGNEGKVSDQKTKNGPKIGDTTQADSTLYYLNQLSGDVTADNAGANDYADELTDVKFGSLFSAIQSMYGDVQGATLTFKLYTKADESSDFASDGFGAGTIAPLNNSANAEDFAIALNYSSSRFFTKGQKVDGSATEIVFNWDDLKKNLAAGTISESAIRIANDRVFQINSVTFDVPALTVDQLNNGTTVTDPTPSTPDASTPDASTPGTGTEGNPVTGNAPIALAIIPVALAAAAVVASKKRA